ncbi:MAG: WD40 repeat domain-containing protein [Planctomycetaceae bacterium]|nr:WD40 repeat domain-containing protein [Planctomycetaceae bacterium]
MVFSTDAGNDLKIPQENAETTVKLLSHDPSLKIADEIKNRGLGLATGQTGDGKRIWAKTRYGGRIWDAVSGKELSSYYLKFPASQNPQGPRSPQALKLEVRDENTLVNRGYMPELRLSPQANLLVSRKNLHSDSDSKGRITTYDTAAKKAIWTHEAETPGEDFLIVGFTPDEQNLIVRKKKQKSLLVLNSRSGKPVTKIKPEAKFEIQSTQAHFTPAGLVLASTDYDDNYALEVWSTTVWKQQGRIEGQKLKPEKRNSFSLQQPEPTEAEILLPKGWGWICPNVLATTEDNKTLNIWDLNQPRFDPSAGKWTGSQIREWPGFNNYLIEVPPDSKGNALARLGLVPVTRTFDKGATLLAKSGDLYRADNHQYLSSLNLKSAPSNATEKITISDNSGQHIRIDASLVLEPPLELKRLIFQASTPALDAYRVSVQTRRLTGVTPLKFAPPNYTVAFENQNGHDSLVYKKEFRLGYLDNKYFRGEIDFAISSNGTIVAPLIIGGSGAALVSIPDGNSYLFELQDPMLPGFCADGTKIAFFSNGGVSLHNAQNGALEQKVAYNTVATEPFLSYLLSPDGSRIISVRKTRQGPVWCITNCLTGKHEGDLPVSTRLKSKNGSDIKIQLLAISADNNKVLFFADQLYLWDIPQQKEVPFNPAAMDALQKTKKYLFSSKTTYTSPLKPEVMRQRVQFTPDSQQIAMLNDSRIEFWGLDSGQLEKTLSLPHSVSQSHLLPDGKAVVYSSGNQIFICDLSAELPHTVLTGTRLLLEQFQVSQNGRYVASVCTNPLSERDGKITHKGMLRIWDLQSPLYGKTNQDSVVIKVSAPQVTKTMASAEPQNKPQRPASIPTPTPTPTPDKPAELSEEQKKHLAAFKSILKEGQNFSGKWTAGKLTGRIALKVAKVKADDTYEIELYEPGKASQTKSFDAAFVPDKDSEKLFLELTPVKGSGLNRSPSRVPKTYNLLLISDTRNYRFILDKTSLVGMDSQGLNYQLFQQ